MSESFPTAVYSLCLLTSLACAWLLGRAYARTSARVLFWSAACFLFLTVNNVTNTRAPLYPSNSGIPGLFYPTLGFHDDMGRFFTLGVRGKF